SLSAPVPAEPTLLSLAIQGGKKEVNVNGRLLLHAQGSYSDGRNNDIKEGVTWESSNRAIATVNNNGIVIGIKEGQTNIIARTGDLASQPLRLAVKPAAPAPEQKTSKVDVSQYIKSAREARDRGDYPQAFAELQKASKIDPSNTEVQKEIVDTRSGCNAERK